MKKYVIAKSFDGNSKVVKIKSIKSIKDYTPECRDERGRLLDIPLPSEYSQVFEVEVENGDKLEVGDVIEHPEYGHSCNIVEVHEEVHGKTHKKWIDVIFPKNFNEDYRL